MTYIPATLFLMNKTITTAVTAGTTTAVTGCARGKNLLLYCNFTYGSGGTSVDVYVQTSLDGEQTWIDIAEFSHTTASLARVYNLTSVTPVTTVYTVTDGSLTANTAKDGIIGASYRVKYTTVGTYAGSTTCQVYGVIKD